VALADDFLRTGGNLATERQEHIRFLLQNGRQIPDGLLARRRLKSAFDLAQAGR